MGILDGDDVFWDTAGAIIDWSNHKLGLQLTRATYHDDFPVLWGVPRGVALQYWAVIKRDVLPEAPLIEGAREGIGELSELMRLQMLTSRSADLLAITRQILRREVGAAIEVVHGATINWDDSNAHMFTKGEDLSRLRPVFYLEDLVRHCNSGIEAGVPIVGIHDRPHNQVAIGLHPDVVRLTWPDVIPHVGPQLEAIAA